MTSPPPPRFYPIKKRLDILLVERGLCDSRNKAQGLILAGNVCVDGQPVIKAGTAVKDDCTVTIKEGHPFVSRGGIKLKHALDFFKATVRDRNVLDIGASTGGFTDCLIKEGAALVVAIDVGYGQIDWQLRQNPKVLTVERTNIRYFSLTDLRASLVSRGLSENSAFSMAVIDVSFISLKLVVPAVIPLLTAPFEIICLIKPQFEAGRDHIAKGGIVRDLETRTRVVGEIRSFISDLNLRVSEIIESPITGADGNIEYLLRAASTGIMPAKL